MTLLKGKTALVTGAAGGGIGRGASMALAEAGAAVVVTARKLEAAEGVADAIRSKGGAAHALALDVTDPMSVEKAVAKTVDHFRGLDIVIQNAVHGASAHDAKLEDVKLGDFEEQGRVALDGAFYLARACFPHLKASGAGRMVFFTSLRGVTGGKANPIYAAHKGALRGLTKALAREWGPYGITVNAVSPAAMSDAAVAYFEAHPEVRGMIEASVPLRRMGDPKTDIGGAIVALASPLMKYVTGQTIFVDGGGYTAL